MTPFSEWIETVRFPDRPWVILGKGPSIDKIGSIDIREYNFLSMNHAVRVVPHVEIAHFIDLEPALACGAEVETRADWLLMPERPHIECTLGPYIEAHLELPPLALMNSSGRLVAYQKEPRAPAYKSPSAIAVRYFSFEAALGILGELGVRRVLTLGVDGGGSYGAAFAELKPFENGRKSFDIQFEAAKEICMHYKMTFEAIK